MKRISMVVLSAGLFLLLSTLVLYGLWLNRVGQAEQAFSETRYQEAQERFHKVWSGWELNFLPEVLVLDDRVGIALNLVQIGYLLGEDDATLELLRGDASLPALVDEAGYHFWMGNLLMAQAAYNPDVNLIETLVRSGDEFLETLRREPEYWDAKYNYEYVQGVLASLRDGESHSEGEMELLLDKMRTDMPRARKVLPPEKRK